jgi:excisionase family DNA binding protein
MSEPSSEKPVRLLHSVSETAELLAIGVSTVWKLIADGKLETVRIGRSRRIPHEALVRLAAPQRSCAKTEVET